MTPEICTKMLKRMSEKLGAKFPVTTPGCSMAPSWKFFNRKQACPVEGQSLQQKEKKRRKRKGEKIPKLIEKPKDVGHLLVQKLQISKF